jgi:GT2 family glycosyltransferase
MYDITCSIVLYNNPLAELRVAVESFLNCTKNVKLLLVDNSETDHLRFEFISPKIEYYFNGINLGFGAGHNIAINQIIAQSKYHIILNPDVEFNSTVLNTLFEFMEKNTDTGLVMPKIVYKNGDMQYLCKKLPSPLDLIVRRFVPNPIKRIFNSILSAYELRHKDYNKMMEVPNLSGCFMFIRNHVFQTVGLFDEQYFMYLEDTDLCRRIAERYRTIYYPNESIIHGYSKASYKNLKLMSYHVNSTIRYFNKWGWYNDQERKIINSSLRSPKPSLRVFSADLLPTAS